MEGQGGGAGDSNPLDREALGRLVRDVWVAWAQEQPDPKASWLAPWEELSEPERDVDRRIGMAIAALAYREGYAAGLAMGKRLFGSARKQDRDI